MHPIFAFTLIEVLVAIAIIAIFAGLYGEQIAAAIGKAMKAGGGTNPVGSWPSAAVTVPANTPTPFNLVVNDQKLDSSGAVVTSVAMPAHSPGMIDLVMITGSGTIVSVTVDGNAMPQNKAATVGSPATNALASTDANGLIIVVIILAPDSQAQLVAHQTPNPAMGGWTVPAITFASQ